MIWLVNFLDPNFIEILGADIISIYTAEHILLLRFSSHLFAGFIEFCPIHYGFVFWYVLKVGAWGYSDPLVALIDMGKKYTFKEKELVTTTNCKPVTAFFPN